MHAFWLLDSYQLLGSHVLCPISTWHKTLQKTLAKYESYKETLKKNNLKTCKRTSSSLHNSTVIWYVQLWNHFATYEAHDLRICTSLALQGLCSVRCNSLSNLRLRLPSNGNLQPKGLKRSGAFGTSPRYRSCNVNYLIWVQPSAIPKIAVRSLHQNLLRKAGARPQQRLANIECYKQFLQDIKTSVIW